MNINIADIAVTSIETITGFDMSGNFKFALDELQSATIANSEETENITGKRGRILDTLKRNKQITISGSNGLMSAGLMEVQTGSNFTSADGAATVRWAETLVVNSNAAATEFKATGTEGAEIVNLYVRKPNGSLGTKMEQASAAAAGKFTYNPSTKALGFYASELADGTEIYVVYDRTIQAPVLTNSYDTFAEKCRLYIDGLGEDSCGNVYRIQFYVPRADISGSFDFTFGDSQSVHSFEATSMAGYCSGTSGNYGWTYTIFTGDAADYTP